MGAARLARERQRRSQARKVEWLFGLARSKSVHHTSPTDATQHPSLFGDLREFQELGVQIATMSARCEDLQLQITALAKLVVGEEKVQAKQEFEHDYMGEASGAGGSTHAGPVVCEPAFAAGIVKEEVEENESQSGCKEVSPVREEPQVLGMAAAACKVDPAITNTQRAEAPHQAPTHKKYKTPGSKLQDMTAKCTSVPATTDTVLSEVQADLESRCPQLDRAEVDSRIDRIMEGPPPDEQTKRELWRLMKLAKQFKAQPG